MAWMNQERKNARMPAIKAVLKKYNLKGSVSVQNHSTLILTIKSGAVDFLNIYKDVTGQDPKGSIQVNEYHIGNYFSGDAKECLVELKAVMLGNDYYNNTDVMTDYFDVSHYIDISIGRWDQPYLLT